MLFKSNYLKSWILDQTMLTVSSFEKQPSEQHKTRTAGRRSLPSGRAWLMTGDGRMAVRSWTDRKAEIRFSSLWYLIAG
ncbi:hypothetical protein JOC77_001207 [Peribacillus deserti]|uniref:Uncharacterized protein n=1 Tax=Peribacillus deserti TaxID=673318 RepID=A0ABS2QFC5_9BACI|nr:hypothetical protein [Peribacillus deserti]MBM7691797.1 hypothetical protein [Peribacillus deserti]